MSFNKLKEAAEAYRDNPVESKFEQLAAEASDEERGVLALFAEVERLTTELAEAKQFRGDGEACLTNRDTLRAALGLKLGDGLHEHVMALQLNAERYLYLRNMPVWPDKAPVVFIQQKIPTKMSRDIQGTRMRYVGPLMGDNLDKVVDTARGAA